MKRIAYLAVVLTLFSATDCTNKELNDIQPAKVNECRVTAKDFVFDGEMTRTSFTVDEEKGLIFQWSTDDVLGIYPIGGDQVAFPISEGGDSKSAVFDGGSWALRPSKEYACYYPFSKDNYFISETSLPATFTGQSQDANNSTAGLGAYDYMAAPATAPDENGCLNITMEHLVSIVRFELNVPSFDGSFREFRIVSDDACITTEGTFDLSKDIPQIVSSKKENILKLNLDDISIKDQDYKATLFLTMCPDDLADVDFKVLLISSSGDVFTGSFTGKSMTAGSAYSYSIDLNKQEGTSYVDLGLSVKWASWNIGASVEWQYGELMDQGSGITKAKNEEGRLPTKDEINELMNSQNCQWTWIENYNYSSISGYLVTSKKEGYTSNSIFLPAAGGNKAGVTLSPGNHGNYWTSDLTTSGTSAYYMYFTPSSHEWRSSNCNYKYSVRLVME